MMRKLALFTSLALFLAACLSEKNIDPANASTFTRYFSDGFANQPVAVEETLDKGFIVLANTNFKNTEADFNKERIEIIKTDQYGHVQWQQYYPDRNFNNKSVRWEAASIIVLESGGYLVVGQLIEGSSTGQSEDDITRRLLLFTVDDTDGTMLDSKIYTGLMPNGFNFPTLNGRAAVKAPATINPTTDSSFYVLALSPDPAVTDNILLAEISSDDLDNVVWTQQYEPDVSASTRVELTNKLFYRPASGLIPNSLFFAGSRIYNETNTNAFVARFGLNESGTFTGLLDIVSPFANEFGTDICERGVEFGLVGYQSKGGALGDIMYCPINSQGEGNTIQTYATEIFEGAKPPINTKEEKGNAIVTSGSGFVIAGTIDTYTGDLGRGNTDMFLFKISATGNKVWGRTFGTPDADAAISVRTTSDGGYVLLGRSRIAALNTVVLIKTDKNGNVD